jgi:cytosine permease
MSTETTSTPSTLPDYIASAQPNPQTNRAPWFKNTAPTYAGIFLWFAFWDPISQNGLTQAGLLASLLGIVIAGLICHYLFYLIPGLLGQKTGLPLYVAGTSTFGTIGGLLMPGFLMGLLQFGWLGVNTFFSSQALADGFHAPVLFYPLCVLWAAAAAFVGLKGIQYVAKVATYLPVIPLLVLLLGLVLFGGSALSFTPTAASESAGGGTIGGLLMMIGAIVGFFATAGAAGVDFGMNSVDDKDVQKGGLVGIVAAVILTAGISVITVAGARASGAITNATLKPEMMTTALSLKLPSSLYAIIMIGLTLAAFPGACFSSFIAANSFKTVMPKVNPFVSVGIGAIVSMILALTRVAENLPSYFNIIGASFGPICGAMAADYLLAGRRWSGPRAGFNPAGWIAWALGFLVGLMPELHKLIPAIYPIPAAPVAAFIVGFAVYFGCAKAGLLTPVVPMPNRIDA